MARTDDRRLRFVARCLAAAAGLAFAASLQAQQSLPTLPAAPAIDTAGATLAPDASPRRAGWSITPHFGVTETFTDNVTMARSGREHADFVTEIKPQIVIRGEGARVKLNLDYSLQKYFYARDSSFDRTQNSLNALGSVEAIEKFFFVDVRAAIGQFSSAPLGPQLVSNANFSTSRVENRLFSLSPYIKGGFGSIANYELRHNAIRTSTDSNTAIADTRSNEWLARLSNRVPLGRFGWAADYSKREYTFRNTERNSESLRGTLSYQFDPELRVSVNAGREKNDFAAGSQSFTNRGVGFEWRPTPRTVVSGHQEDRFFGKGYNYQFSHRTPLSAWTLGYVKDVTSTADQMLTLVPTDAYLVLFNDPGVIAAFPNPADRDAAIRHDLGILGIPATTNETLLTNNVILNKRLNGSFALIGARNTVTFSFARSQSSSASGIALAGADIFAFSSTIRQRTISGSWVHNISALSTLNLLASQTLSEGSAPVTQTTKHRMLNLTLSHKLGPKTLGTLGLRKVRFDAQGGSSASYDEKAVTGSLSLTF